MVLIADYQTLTDRDAPGSLPADVLGQVADYLAVGIDPQRAAIFAHSQIEPLNQLLIPFLSLVSVAEVSRNPTVKEEFGASGGSSMSALMFAYPVHQAADILFCHANLVPVGKDQLPHLELTRTIVRRFNDRYCPAQPYFAAPDALLSEAPLLLGTDGQKMSKSRNNAIALAASEDETARLIRAARTDDQRTITYQPESRPAVSNLVQLAALCLETSPEQVAAGLGDGGAAALKRLLTEALNERLRPIRAWLTATTGPARWPPRRSPTFRPSCTRATSRGARALAGAGAGQEERSRVGRAVSSTVPPGRRTTCQVFAPSTSVMQSTRPVPSKTSPVPSSDA